MSEKIDGVSNGSKGILYVNLFGPKSALDRTVSPPVDSRTTDYKVVEVIDKCISLGIYYCRYIPGGNIVPIFLRMHSCSFDFQRKKSFVPMGNDPAFNTHTDFEKNGADDYLIDELVTPIEYKETVVKSLSQTNFAEGGAALDYLADLVMSYISPFFAK